MRRQPALPTTGGDSRPGGTQRRGGTRGARLGTRPDSYDADADGDYLEARQWLRLRDACIRAHWRLSMVVHLGTGATITANPEVRLFYGSNDGFVHMPAIPGNTAAAESGRETWAFMPPSLLAVQAARGDGLWLPAGLHRYGMDIGGQWPMLSTAMAMARSRHTGRPGLGLYRPAAWRSQPVRL